MRLTVQEYVARTTEKKAQDLLAAAYAVPGDKHNWKPLGQGRSVIDLIAECAVTNEMSIKLLQERAWDDAGHEERRKAHAALDTLAKASAKLQENTSALAAAIRALPDDHLELEITLPGETSTVADDLLHPYWNMAYHEGQINYIRALSEDHGMQECHKMVSVGLRMPPLYPQASLKIIPIFFHKPLTLS